MDYEIKQVLMQDNIGLYEAYFLIDYKNCKLNKFGLQHLAEEEAIKRGLRKWLPTKLLNLKKSASMFAEVHPILMRCMTY